MRLPLSSQVTYLLLPSGRLVCIGVTHVVHWRPKEACPCAAEVLACCCAGCATLQPGEEDPFTRMGKEKRERVSKNRKQQQQNAKAAAAVGQLPATLKLTESMPAGSGGNSKAGGPKALPKQKRKELKEEVSSPSRGALSSSPGYGGQSLTLLSNCARGALDVAWSSAASDSKNVRLLA